MNHVAACEHVSRPSCSNQESKKARKEAEKEQKQKALQQKRGAIEEMLAGMTEEEQQQWRQKNQVRHTIALLHANYFQACRYVCMEAVAARAMTYLKQVSQSGLLVQLHLGTPPPAFAAVWGINP
jgi:hypothetical protein